jgi:hypothetical protein
VSVSVSVIHLAATAAADQGALWRVRDVCCRAARRLKAFKNLRLFGDRLCKYLYYYTTGLLVKEAVR